MSDAYEPPDPDKLARARYAANAREGVKAARKALAEARDRADEEPEEEGGKLYEFPATRTTDTRPVP